jgi:hypothetical protein
MSEPEILLSQNSFDGIGKVLALLNGNIKSSGQALHPPKHSKNNPLMLSDGK